MATARSQRSRPRARAGTAVRRRAPSGSHHRLAPEIGAIACVALAIFLTFVMFLGWHGGVLGSGLERGLRALVGLLTYAAPMLLLYLAVLLAADRERRPLPAASAGIVILCLAFVLAAAADSFGIFPGERPSRLFLSAYTSRHGGLVGETLWAGSRFLLGRIGTDVAVIAGLVAGVLLVSGSSLRLWLRHSRRGVKAAGRVTRESAHTLAERRRSATERLQQVLAANGNDDRAVTRVLRRTPLSGGETGVTSYGPAVSTHGPRPVDAARNVPEFYPGSLRRASHAGAAAAVASSAPGREEQLSLAAEAAKVADEDVAALFTPAPTRAWTLPDPAILRRLGAGRGETPATMEEVSRRMVETLASFAVQSEVVNTVTGPRVTRYELQLAPGTKVSRVASLKADLAYALAATEIRVQAPIPGKTAVGVEVPNVTPSFVALGDVYGGFPPGASPLAFWLGKDITGKAVLADLARMVHVLVAGTTGSGKSACINCVLSSILLRATPDQVRLILVDPKKVELSHFEGVPHLLTPVVTDMRRASYALANLVHEMERRYELMAATDNAQNLRELNRKRERLGEATLPYILLVIDELADMMLVAPNDVENAITRLGQLGRGAGVHMVVATQRPSVDVITGLIKANIPSRVAFAVSSQTDSRVILDTGGAESLLGEGDMLFHPLGSTRMLRVQGAFVDAEEMKLITGHWRAQARPEFHEELLESPGEGGAAAGHGGREDELLPDAITTVVATGAASVALLQRRLRVGYARAGRLIDIMEERGIISGYDGSKARKVLVEEDDLARILADLRGAGADPGGADAADGAGDDPGALEKSAPSYA